MRLVSLLVAGLFIGGPARAEPFEVSMEAWHHQHIQYLRSGSPLEKNQVLKKIKSPLLHDEIEVALDLRDRAKPLIVVIPGLFGGYNTVECHRVSQWLGEKNFNVLRVPNPVSAHVVKRASPVIFARVSSCQEWISW